MPDFCTNIAGCSHCVLELAEQEVFCKHFEEGCLSILF